MKQSESIAQLCAAWIKAQSAIQNLYPSSKGYGYDYVPLEKVIDHLKEVLPKFGLGYVQLPISGDNGTVGLVTRIIHESGEWLEEEAEFPLTDMKGVNKTQAGGAAITYFRRYALLSAFGITGDKDVDASDHAFKTEPKTETKAVDSEELRKTKTVLLDWINSGVLSGKYLDKANYYLTSNNLEGMKQTIEYCKSQQSA